MSADDTIMVNNTASIKYAVIIYNAPRLNDNPRHDLNIMTHMRRLRHDGGMMADSQDTITIDIMVVYFFSEFYIPHTDYNIIGRGEIVDIEHDLSRPVPANAVRQDACVSTGP